MQPQLAGLGLTKQPPPTWLPATNSLCLWGKAPRNVLNSLQALAYSCGRSLFAKSPEWTKTSAPKGSIQAVTARLSASTWLQQRRTSIRDPSKVLAVPPVCITHVNNTHPLGLLASRSASITSPAVTQLRKDAHPHNRIRSAMHFAPTTPTPLAPEASKCGRLQRICVTVPRIHEWRRRPCFRRLRMLWRRRHATIPRAYFALRPWSQRIRVLGVRVRCCDTINRATGTSAAFSMKGRAEQNSKNHRSAVSSNAPLLLLNWNGIYVFLFQFCRPV